jgi:inhibitor of cysteine peptidase
MLLTEGDNGKRFAHPADELLGIALGESPTTGYRWGFVDLDPSIQLVDDTYAAEGDRAPGAGTTRLFRLAFSRSGEYRIALRLWRDWEGDASTTDRYAVTVDMKEDE